MKKLLLMCIWLLAAIGANAQSTAWMAILDGDDETNMAVMLGLDEDKSCMQKIIIEQKDEDLGLVNVCVEGEGKYSLKKDVLQFNIKPDDVKVYIGDVEWSKKVKKECGKDAAAYEKVKKNLEAAMQTQQQQFASMLKMMKTMKIISTTEDTMVIQLEGDTEKVTFRKMDI